MELPSRRSPHRLVHLITSLHVGGAQMHLYKTLTRMDRKKFFPTVISLVQPGRVGELLAREGIAVLSLGMNRGRPEAGMVLRLYRLLRRLKPNLLQTHLYHADLLGWLAGKLALVPRIFWNIRQSAMEFGHYRRTTAWTVACCARLSPRVDKILVNSCAGLACHAALGYDRTRMVMVPNGFDTERFRPDAGSYREVRQELGLPAGARLVGLMARLDPQKDHGNFLQAANLVSAKIPESCFLLAGKGLSAGNPELEPLLAAAGLERKRCFLLGERLDMPNLTAALDVAVSASSFGEGFPNTVGEAMACGVPCVVTDVGDSAAIVGNTGAVVPPRDPVRLAREIISLLSLEPEAYRRQSDAARQRLSRKFGIDLVARRLEELYLESLALAPRPAANTLAPLAPGW